MKKYSILALVLVLTAALFAGCRGRNQTGDTMAPTTGTVAPTVYPTTEATQPATTHAPTEHTTEHTTEHMTTEATEDIHGNGTVTEGTTGVEGRARGVVPGAR